MTTPRWMKATTKNGSEIRYRDDAYDLDGKLPGVKVVGQDDDNDYSESGYIAFIYEGKAYITNYRHCSCYGTADVIFTSSEFLPDKIPVLCWGGTVDEMVEMAKRKADPDRPERTMMEEDFDYDHLMNVYDQIIAWDSEGRK